MIGSRWTPGERVLISTELGRYEHVNPSRHVTRDESMLQAALAPALSERRRPSRTGSIAGALLATVIAICLAAAAVHFLSA